MATKAQKAMAAAKANLEKAQGADNAETEEGLKLIEEAQTAVDALEETIPEAEGGAEKKGIVLPQQVHELKGQAAERAKIWARMEKSGALTLCNVRDGKKRCYYPLDVVRNPADLMNPTIVESEELDGQGKPIKGMLARCSFHPTEHGDQIIMPKKQEDQI